MNAQELKNSILQLAVQGKLVPQDPNDEPASALIERIRAEKERLIKEKKIKPDKNPSYIFRGSDNLPYEKVGKNEPVCIADEVTFDIPDSWEWVRLGNVCNIARGGSPRPIQDYLTKDDDGINWIKIGDSDIGGKYISKTKEKIKKEGITKSRMVHKGDFLLTNSMSFGRPYILNTDGCIHDGWLVLSDYQKAYNIDFLYFMLSSRFAFCQFCSVVSGAVVKNLNSDKVANAIFPLPPLIEQQRIVEKLKKLEPYINDYDKAYEKIEKLNTDFPDLLKKSILQEAVQGKLVPQDSSDEPASVLLERIRAEKQRLIAEGKIKKDKHESVIFRRDNSHYEKLDGIERCIDNEIPFDIPDIWTFVRLQTICKKITDGEHKTPKRVTDYCGFFLLSARNVRDGYISLNDVDYVNKTEYLNISKRCNPVKNDILISCSGSVGRCCTVDDDNNYVMVRSAAMISPIQCNSKYIMYAIQSPMVQKQISEKIKQAVQANLFQGAIRELLIPVPTLEEQFRIVNQIETILPALKKLH